MRPELVALAPRVCRVRDPLAAGRRGTLARIPHRRRDEPPELAFYCQRCAEREFAD